jgi:hypothetical protein
MGGCIMQLQLSIRSRVASIVTLLAATMLGACALPAEDVGETEAAASSANPGTPRPQRVVLIQAESDASQAAFFRAMRNATVVSSYEAGIYWARENATPTVQQKFDGLVDTYLTKIEADLTTKQTADASYEETIILGLAGHSSGFTFFGHADTAEGNTNHVSLKPEAVQALAQKFPRFAKNVRGLLLLGCNAGHKDKMDLWRRPFANVTAVAGFNSRAPDGQSGANYLVKWSLGEWSRLNLFNRGAQLPTDGATLFRGMANCRATRCLGSVSRPTWSTSPTDWIVQGSPAWAIIVGGVAHWDAVYPPDGASTVSARIALLQGEYDKYLAASDANHADPPADTSTGLVRQFNNLSQQYLAAVGARATDADRKRAQQSIRLTLYRDIKEAWIEENDALVRSLGLDPPALSRATRRDTIIAIRALPAQKQLSAEGKRIKAALIDLDTTELPDTLL